jgi:hypothetical protein
MNSSREDADFKAIEWKGTRNVEEILVPQAQRLTDRGELAPSTRVHQDMAVHDIECQEPVNSHRELN